MSEEKWIDKHIREFKEDHKANNRSMTEMFVKMTPERLGEWSKEVFRERESEEKELRRWSKSVSQKDFAQITALSMFDTHYMILLDSESDKGEEILVHDLAKKAATASATFIIKLLSPMESKAMRKLLEDYVLVLKEIEKL